MSVTRSETKEIVRTIADDLQFAADCDAPIRYMERTKAWYLALGYDNPYRWAHFATVPFSVLRKPLREARIALITTAAPYRPGKGNQGPRAPYNAAAKFYEVYSKPTDEDPDLRISHVAIDRKHTTAEDIGTYFPLRVLREAVRDGRIGSLTAHFLGVPTNRSQRHTVAIDCPEVIARCEREGADVAILVPNCPVCHQTCSLVARHLEAHGISTVVMGAAKDIVEYVGVPRLCFSDFPLGNAAGRPNDRPSQAKTLELALRLLETAPVPRTTVQNPLRWLEPPAWHLDYCNPAALSKDELARLRRENDEEKRIAKATRDVTYPS